MPRMQRYMHMNRPKLGTFITWNFNFWHLKFNKSILKSLKNSGVESWYIGNIISNLKVKISSENSKDDFERSTESILLLK